MLARVALTALGVVQLAVALWHGTAHTELAVALSLAQQIVVYVVVLLIPLIAVDLVWTRHVRLAVRLFLIARYDAHRV